MNVLGSLSTTTSSNQYISMLGDWYTELTTVIQGLNPPVCYLHQSPFTALWLLTVYRNISRPVMYLCCFNVLPRGLLIFTQETRHDNCIPAQGNGKVKTLDRTIVYSLLRQNKEQQNDWEQYNETLACVYRTQIPFMTGTAAFNLVMSRQPPIFAFKNPL